MSSAGAASSRHGSPSDYFSESERSRSRLGGGRLTPTSGGASQIPQQVGGAGGSRPASRNASDLAAARSSDRPR